MKEVHRDDHYIIGIITKGSGEFVCDMQLLKFKATSVLIMKPYQVHSFVKSTKNAEAFFLSVAPFIVPDACAAIFRSLEATQQHLVIPEEEKPTLLSTAHLLNESFKETHLFKTFILNGLFDSLVYRIAGIFSDRVSRNRPAGNKSQEISMEFSNLLATNSVLNLPSFFAEKLNISTSHLNDCVKASTGFSVTHWLQHAMILEAKRNLYYTNKDVKQVAYDLGFEDHTYFSRLFKKLTSETPLEFRNKFRE